MARFAVHWTMTIARGLPLAALLALTSCKVLARDEARAASVDSPALSSMGMKGAADATAIRAPSHEGMAADRALAATGLAPFRWAHLLTPRKPALVMIASVTPESASVFVPALFPVRASLVPVEGRPLSEMFVVGGVVYRQRSHARIDGVSFDVYAPSSEKGPSGADILVTEHAKYYLTARSNGSYVVPLSLVEPIK